MQGLPNFNYKVASGANESVVMNVIRRRGPISRVDIAKLTDLTPPTVTNITNKLMEWNYITEYMIGESSGGRRPVLLKANPDLADLVVIKARSREIVGYLINGGFEIKKQISHSIKDVKQEDALSLLLETIEACLAESSSTVAAVGIIVRGPVKFSEGISVFAPNIGWRNVPLKFIVEDKFHIPTFVENDVQAMAQGEYYYGPDREAKSLIFLGVSYGLAAGIVINGELYRGLSNSAGEFGHTTVDVAGPVCSCGNYGCLEALASEAALVAAMVKSIKEGRDSLVCDLVDGDMEAVRAEHVYQAAEQGDELAGRILRQIARYLGIGVANIINIFNPEMVIIGDGIVRGRKFIEETMQQTIRERALESCYGPASIRFSATGDESMLKGIVDLVLRNIL
ncbi:Hypothetical protein LUCI_1786 [Lucifera butyrica]|uniref:Uncharacterized protein n=2 Tax=Lucifera butyrica TaxID=1351585 RepID=A0A498R6L9_9FIRM|nr:Hypothetical protein LUCI_1786 [Lucifera butyrica]